MYSQIPLKNPAKKRITPINAPAKISAKTFPIEYFIPRIISTTNLRTTNIFGENREDVAYLWKNYFDDEENLLEMELAFFIKDEDEKFNRFEEIHQQRAYTEEEIIELLQEAGFENIKVFGDFTFESPKEDAERIFFVCKK
jgi:hypothetical protein